MIHLSFLECRFLSCYSPMCGVLPLVVFLFPQCKLILSWDLVPWESHVLDYGSIPKGSFVCSSVGALQV